MILPGMVVVFIIILVVFYVSGYPIPPILLRVLYAIIITLLIVIALQTLGLLGSLPPMRVTHFFGQIPSFVGKTSFLGKAPDGRGGVKPGAAAHASHKQSFVRPLLAKSQATFVGCCTVTIGRPEFSPIGYMEACRSFRHKATAAYFS
jgi:hypothetical protein